MSNNDILKEDPNAQNEKKLFADPKMNKILIAVGAVIVVGIVAAALYINFAL